MKRLKLNYHSFQVLKTAQPKLRKAIISNCKREILNCISECILNVLNGNLKVSDCAKQKLRKHKSLLRKVTDKRVSPSVRKRLINQHGRFILTLLTVVLATLANLLFGPRVN
jgi:hypothetical protein